MNNETHIIVLKNIAGQCINETKLQTFNFGAKINICEAQQRFQYISDMLNCKKQQQKENENKKKKKQKQFIIFVLLIRI